MIDQLGGLVDLHPTLASIAGAAPNPDLDGIDLSGTWRGDGEALDRTLSFRRGQSRSVRHGRWKWLDGRLFDLDADPRETIDLAGEHPAVAGRLATVADG